VVLGAEGQEEIAAAEEELEGAELADDHLGAVVQSEHSVLLSREHLSQGKGLPK
jgi:hypothetical protein